MPAIKNSAQDVARFLWDCFNLVFNQNGNALTLQFPIAIDAECRNAAENFRLEKADKMAAELKQAKIEVNISTAHCEPVNNISMQMATYRIVLDDAKLIALAKLEKEFRKKEAERAKSQGI